MKGVIVTDNELDQLAKRSPCKSCLVQPCCNDFCQPFINYYTSVRILIQTDVEKEGFDLTSKKGRNKYQTALFKLFPKVTSVKAGLDYIEYLVG